MYKLLLHAHQCISASQAWTLGRLLPLMIGSKVPESNLQWKHYVDMLQICKYMMAPNILPEEVAVLQVMLTDFITDLTLLYSNAVIIPKLHYLLHVPRLLLK